MKTKMILLSVLASAGSAVMAQSWSLTGNAGTVDGTNFLGTTDNVPLNFRVSNQPSGRIDHLNENALFGYQSGNAITSGASNSGFGHNTLLNITSGNYNSAFGARALRENTTGNYNSGFGTNALINNNSGYNNTAVGITCLGQNTTGYDNTGIGMYNLINNTTGYLNSALGSGADVSIGTLTNAIVMGGNAVVNASDKVVIGVNHPSMVIGGYANWSNLSDGRFKENVKENVPGLDFITRLRPVTYTINNKKLDEHVMQNMSEDLRARKMQNAESYAAAAQKIQTGFIAQEVEKTAKELGYAFDGINAPKNNTDNYSIAYSQFIMPLVKAVQEQQQMIKDLKQEISDLKNAKITGLNELNSANSNVYVEQNIPNPFNSETLIKYSLPAGANAAHLAIYDLSGKQINSFPITEKGASSIKITSDKLAAGIYIYSIIADGKVVDSKRMIVSEK